MCNYELDMASASAPSTVTQTVCNITQHLHLCCTHTCQVRVRAPWGEIFRADQCSTSYGQRVWGVMSVGVRVCVFVFVCVCPNMLAYVCVCIHNPPPTRDRALMWYQCGHRNRGSSPK